MPSLADRSQTVQPLTPRWRWRWVVAWLVVAAIAAHVGWEIGGLVRW